MILGEESHMRLSTKRFLRICAGLSALVSPVLWAQNIPNGGVGFQQQIQIANWQTSGPAANFDIFGFDPATRIMYIADRTNKGITAINTRTNVSIGFMPMPNASSPNGVIVAPDLRKLAVTDGQSNLWVWDLRLPGNPPVQYAIPNIGGGTDALDYDPLNETIYFINGTAPYYITGVNLAFGKLASQMQLPWSPELTAFNPTDGEIYQVITDNDNKNANAGVIVYDPGTNKMLHQYLVSNCVPHGIQIDPVVNTALIGCGNTPSGAPAGQILMNLKDGSVIHTFPDVTGSDLLAYNPNLRRFYTGSGTNRATTSGCPTDSSNDTPIMGIISSPISNGMVTGQLNGVVCTGRNGHGLGVDPIENNVYVAVVQYPVNSSNANTGSPGVLVFHDSTPPAQPLTTQTQAVLSPIGGASAAGMVSMTLDARVVRVAAMPTGVTAQTVLINVPTTVGNEVIPCAGNVTSAFAQCGADLIGDPLIGATVTLSGDGVPLGRGVITGM
jgi:hypothetical protein